MSKRDRAFCEQLRKGVKKVQKRNAGFDDFALRDLRGQLEQELYVLNNHHSIQYLIDSEWTKEDIEIFVRSKWVNGSIYLHNNKKVSLREHVQSNAPEDADWSNSSIFVSLKDYTVCLITLDDEEALHKMYDEPEYICLTGKIAPKGFARQTLPYIPHLCAKRPFTPNTARVVNKTIQSKE